MDNIYKNVKPLFKYIGGKTWLKDELRKEVSNVLENNLLSTYIEPFAGGLGAFLSVYDILKGNNIKTVILSDINTSLIHLYIHIKDNPEALIKEFIVLEQGFMNTVPSNINTIKSKEEIKLQLANAELYFKNIRSEFNANKNINSITQCARLVFLQKHSFNGVYRENLKGQYNTPFNWSGNTMIDSFAQKIRDLNEVFALFNITFMNTSYSNLEYDNNTLYYLDPPYINEDIVENKYHKEHFDVQAQLNLLEKIQGLNFVYSNHYSELLVKKLKQNTNISLRSIMRKNIMSASNESRKTDKQEVLASHKI